MNSHLSQYLDSRVTEILRGLRERNSDFSASSVRYNDLLDRVGVLISHEGGVTLSESECHMVDKMLQLNAEITAVSRRELYYQGCLDCMRMVLSLVK